MSERAAPRVARGATEWPAAPPYGQRRHEWPAAPRGASGATSARERRVRFAPFRNKRYGDVLMLSST